jgi:hypothetical protein
LEEMVKLMRAAAKGPGKTSPNDADDLNDTDIVDNDSNQQPKKDS